jgi:hypothetical protein
MRLSSDERRAAYYGLAGFIRDRKIAGRSIPREVVLLYLRLERSLSVSFTRHQTGCGAEDDPSSKQDSWIDSPEVAELLGWTIRKVQRHAANMGARLIGGRWLFRESAVMDYMEGLALNAG